MANPSSMQVSRLENPVSSPLLRLKSPVVIFLLLAFYLINGLYYMQQTSVTFDEAGHFQFGIRILKGSTSREGEPTVLNSKMPVTALNGLPRAAEQLLHPGLKKTDFGFGDLLRGRYITLFVSLLTGLYVYRWSRLLYGEMAGLFSLFLFTFCPNCLAYAVLVGTDAYAVLALLAVSYHLWRFIQSRKMADFLIFSLCTGAAQLTKQSLFHLYIIIPVVLAIYFLATGRHRFNTRYVLTLTGIFLLINLLVINAGFLFQGLGTPLSGYVFISNTFGKVQHTFSWMGHLPLPFPRSFIIGLDMAKHYDEVGGGIRDVSSGEAVTILGETRFGQGFWYFYFVSFFYKTPIPTLCFVAWALVLLIRRTGRHAFLHNELFLLFPVIYFFVFMDFFYKTQAGIRHFIFIYPLLYVFCGIIIRYLRNSREKILLAVLSVWYVISVLSYFGNYLPYTNEFICDKKMAYKKVCPLDLNYGQALFALQHYLKKNPDVFMATSVPRPGRQLVAADELIGVWDDLRNQYEWLRAFQPAGHVAHCYLIYNITADQLKKTYE